MPDEVPLIKKMLPTVGRGLWYVCGLILLLSLPTFSYLVPTLQGPSIDGRRSDSSGFVNREKSAGASDASSTPGDQFVRSKSDGFFSRGSYPGVLRSANRGRSRRIGTNRMATRSKRGLDRLSQRSGQQAGTSVETPEDSSQGGGESEGAQPDQTAASELTQMEEALQSTLNYLFPAQSQPYGSANPNPFQSALNGRAGGGSFNDSSGDQNPADDGDADEGEGSDDTGGGSENDGSSGSSDSDDETDDGDAETRRFDFLLVGEFVVDDQKKTVARAHQVNTGSYILEDGSTVSLSAGSGVVGIPQKSYLLSEDEFLLSADFTGDGVEDVVVGGWEYPASYIQGFTGRGETLAFEAVLQFVRLKSLAVYDFESDGAYEIGALFSGNPNLVVYKIDGEQLRYSREISVPFEPTVLVSTQDLGVFRRHYLQVFGKSLQRSIVFSSLFPGTYSFSSPSTFQTISKVGLDPPDESSQGEEFSVLRYEDVIVVLEIQEEGVVVLASLSHANGYPKLAIGRSAEGGSRQIIFVPRGG